MKSVGEVMAIGRNFTEALGKALRSLEDPEGAVRLRLAARAVEELLRRRPGRTTAGCRR
jgi:carbamoyl-phosphate synthase large subunit